MKIKKYWKDKIMLFFIHYYRWSNLCDLKIINTDKFHRENKFRLKRFILYCIIYVNQKNIVLCPLQKNENENDNTFFYYMTKHIFIYFYIVIMKKKNPLFILPIRSQNIFWYKYIYVLHCIFTLCTNVYVFLNYKCTVG